MWRIADRWMGWTAVVVTGALVSACVGFSQAPDRGKWTTHAVRLSEWRLAFDVPGGQLAESWFRPWKQDVNLDGDLKAGRNREAFETAWDYSGHFFEGRFGTLRMLISVGTRNERDDRNFAQPDQLAEYLRGVITQEYEADNARYRKAGLDAFLFRIPKSFDLVTIQGRQWVQFKVGGQSNYYAYVTGLREDRCLVARFQFVDNTRGKKRQDWRADAERLHEEIVKTLRLERVS